MLLLPLLALLLIAVVHSVAAERIRQQQYWLESRVFRFDGEVWWLERQYDNGECIKVPESESLDGIGQPYVGPFLQVWRLGIPPRCIELMVWRWQCDSETWRRLQLANRYASQG